MPKTRRGRNGINEGNVTTVVFDAFGTLAAVGKQYHPYRRLFEQARAAGRRPHPDDAAYVMAHNTGPREIGAWLGLSLTEAQLTDFEIALAAELPTISLFPDAVPTLAELRARGIRLGVCSNLAPPYAPPVLALLPFPFDGYVWSFEIGAVKPSYEIYEAVCNVMRAPPAEILFVGDSYEADCAGPRQFGMQALHLVRHGDSPDVRPIRSLHEIVEWIDRH